MKKKVYMFITVVATAVTGALIYTQVKVEANTCEELETYLSTMTESQRSHWFMTEHSKECINLHKYVKCYRINQNLRCLDGKIYGPGEGGTKPCEKQTVPNNCVPCAWWE